MHIAKEKILSHFVKYINVHVENLRVAIKTPKANKDIQQEIYFLLKVNVLSISVMHYYNLK